MGKDKHRIYFPAISVEFPMSALLQFLSLPRTASTVVLLCSPIPPHFRHSGCKGHYYYQRIPLTAPVWRGLEGRLVSSKSESSCSKVRKEKDQNYQEMVCYCTLGSGFRTDGKGYASLLRQSRTSSYDQRW